MQAIAPRLDRSWNRFRTRLANASNKRASCEGRIADQIPRADFCAAQGRRIREKQTRKIRRLLPRPAHEANKVWRRHSVD